MPEWNTSERGRNRDEESSYYAEQHDYDGLSCADLSAVSGRGPRSVEALDMLTESDTEDE